MRMTIPTRIQQIYFFFLIGGELNSSSWYHNKEHLDNGDIRAWQTILNSTQKWKKKAEVQQQTKALRVWRQGVSEGAALQSGGATSSFLRERDWEIGVHLICISMALWSMILHSVSAACLVGIVAINPHCFCHLESTKLVAGLVADSRRWLQRSVWVARGSWTSDECCVRSVGLEATLVAFAELGTTQTM